MASPQELFFYYNPHPGRRGPYPRSHFARTKLGLCTYSARTLHMFWHILLMFRQIREICHREVRDNFPFPRSSSSTLVYRHWHLFLCDFFAPEKLFVNILSTLWTFPGEPYPSPNILFVYCIVLFYIRYLPQMKNSRGNVLKVDKQVWSWCSHWSQICFCPPGRFSC